MIDSDYFANLRVAATVIKHLCRGKPPGKPLGDAHARHRDPRYFAELEVAGATGASTAGA